MNTKQVRPCHSIHCRHYDLADGMMCEIEAQRIAAEERLNKRTQYQSDPTWEFIDVGTTITL